MPRVPVVVIGPPTNPVPEPTLVTAAPQFQWAPSNLSNCPPEQLVMSPSVLPETANPSFDVAPVTAPGKVCPPAKVTALLNVTPLRNVAAPFTSSGVAGVVVPIPTRPAKYFLAMALQADRSTP